MSLLQTAAFSITQHVAIPFCVNLLSFAVGIGLGFGYLILDEKVNPPVRTDISDITRIVKVCFRFGFAGVVICLLSYWYFIGWKTALSIIGGDAAILLALKPTNKWR